MKYADVKPGHTVLWSEARTSSPRFSFRSLHVATVLDTGVHHRWYADGGYSGGGGLSVFETPEFWQWPVTPWFCEPVVCTALTPGYPAGLTPNGGRQARGPDGRGEVVPWPVRCPRHRGPARQRPESRPDSLLRGRRARAGAAGRARVADPVGLAAPHAGPAPVLPRGGASAVEGV